MEQITRTLQCTFFFVFFVYKLTSVFCRGNNIFAFGPSGLPAFQGSSPLVFNATYDDSLDPSDPSNLDASITNAFYLANMVHDIAYKYGFTESAFNFQETNLKNGGKGGDRVHLSVQDKGGLDNANFATPPEYVHGHNLYCITSLTVMQWSVGIMQYVYLGYDNSQT